jgi:hypothetical protein
MADIKVYSEYVKLSPVVIPAVSYPNTVILATSSVIDDYTSNNLTKLTPTTSLGGNVVVGNTLTFVNQLSIKVTPNFASSGTTYPNLVILSTSTVIDDYTSNNLTKLIPLNAVTTSAGSSSTLIVNGIKSVNVSSGSTSVQTWTVS